MSKRVLPRPDSYVIYGAHNISKALGVCDSTFYRWIRTAGLPAAKSPGGVYMMTKGMIDLWVTARFQAENEERKIKHGTDPRSGHGSNSEVKPESIPVGTS